MPLDFPFEPGQGQLTFGICRDTIPLKQSVTEAITNSPVIAGFSQKWYDYTGLTEEESVGMRWKVAFHPEDMPATERGWQHSLATGAPYSTEYRCRSKDGEWRWMLGRALPMRDSAGVIEKWFGMFPP